MGHRLTDEERLEEIFGRETRERCEVLRDRIDLQMRVRFKDLAPAKRGRPQTRRAKPPIVAQESIA